MKTHAPTDVAHGLNWGYIMYWMYCVIFVVLIVGVDFFSRFLVGYFFKSWGKIVVSVMDLDHGQFFIDESGHICDLKCAKVFQSFREARKFVDSLDLHLRGFYSIEILEVFNCHKKTGYRKSLP